MQVFYRIVQGENERVQIFVLHFERALKVIKQQHPFAMTEEEGVKHLKDHLFHGLKPNIHNALCYMYDKPGSQHSQLIMAAQKAETEMTRSSVSEARAKSTVVGTASASQAKVASSDPPYEALIQQIAYLMSAITNQNLSKNNGHNVSKSSNGNGKYSSTKFQRSKWDRNDMKSWGCGATGDIWRECSTPRQGNILPFKPNNQIQNQIKSKFKWPTGGGNMTIQSSPSDNQGGIQGGININGQLRQAGESNGPEYYNPNPWVRILSRANETEIEIDGKISTASIGSGPISMMSKGYCDEHRYEIQPLDWLVPIEGSGGADVPYLGYVEVGMQIPEISSFDQDILMLISHTTTHYHRWIPVQVGSQIIDQVTNCITEDELQSFPNPGNWHM